MDVVSLRAGDKLTVSYMNDEISRESCPLPDNAPPELMNSLTLIKLGGNTLARYERLKSSPDGQLTETKSNRSVHPLSPEMKGARRKLTEVGDNETGDALGGS